MDLYGNVNLSAFHTTVICDNSPSTVIVHESCEGELAFIGIAFSDNAHMLSDPNVWILCNIYHTGWNCK